MRGRQRKHCYSYFWSLAERDSSVGQKVLFRVSWNPGNFGPGFQPKQQAWQILTCCVFLWAIAVSDFRLLEIYKNLSFPLSTITFTIYFHAFTVNSHANNHFYKYIYLFQILCCLKISFFIKIHVKVLTKVFYIQIWFKCETPLLLFLIKTIIYR